MDDTQIRVGIVGARGYIGLTLLRLLAGHPQVRIEVATSREMQGQPVALPRGTPPALRGLRYAEPTVAQLRGLDAIFFAAPHGVAAAMAPELLGEGVALFDVSADFRLRDADIWARWYEMEHPAPQLLEGAVYGLAELAADRLRQRDPSGSLVVACPGCYPTCALLPLLPLLARGAIDPGAIIVDAKSGVSGAGRTPSVELLFSEANENFKAYGTGGHRHHPEMLEQLQAASGEPVGLAFTPHLVPMTQGLFSTIYVRPSPGADPAALLADFYAEAPFVSVLDGEDPQTGAVTDTNSCLIRVLDTPGLPGHSTILSALDNLHKGAAGQAVQCMNLAFGLPETAGLRAWGGA